MIDIYILLSCFFIFGCYSIYILHSDTSFEKSIYVLPWITILIESSISLLSIIAMLLFFVYQILVAHVIVTVSICPWLIMVLSFISLTGFDWSTYSHTHRQLSINMYIWLIFIPIATIIFYILSNRHKTKDMVQNFIPHGNETSEEENLINLDSPNADDDLAELA